MRLDYVACKRSATHTLDLLLVDGRQHDVLWGQRCVCVGRVQEAVRSADVRLLAVEDAPCEWLVVVLVGLVRLRLYSTEDAEGVEVLLCVEVVPCTLAASAYLLLVKLRARPRPRLWGLGALHLAAWVRRICLMHVVLIHIVVILPVHLCAVYRLLGAALCTALATPHWRCSALCSAARW